MGIDVIYTATSGSADDAFEAIVKANTAKIVKKNASDVYLILTEPDLYLTVTPNTSKYLIGICV
jgi:basic membrane protein A and related proteins